jgi:hypothetical protein
MVAKQSSIYSFPSGKMNGLTSMVALLTAENQGNKSVWSNSQVMWFLADVIGSLSHRSHSVVSFSTIVVPDHSIFSINVVPKPPM